MKKFVITFIDPSSKQKVYFPVFADGETAVKRLASTIVSASSDFWAKAGLTVDKIELVTDAPPAPTTGV